MEKAKGRMICARHIAPPGMRTVRSALRECHDAERSQRIHQKKLSNYLRFVQEMLHSRSRETNPVITMESS